MKEHRYVVSIPCASVFGLPGQVRWKDMLVEAESMQAAVVEGLRLVRLGYGMSPVTRKPVKVYAVCPTPSEIKAEYKGWVTK